MQHRLTKTYEGPTLSAPNSGVIFLPITVDGTITDVIVEFGSTATVLDAITGAIWNIRLNGVKQWAGGSRLIFAPGSRTGSKTGLTIACEAEDDFHLDLEQVPNPGGVPPPLVLTVIIEDGESPGGAESMGDLSDVDLAGIEGGDVLIYDEGTETFLPGPMTGGGGSGVVETIVPGSGIDVDDTDPANPVVSVESGVVQAGATQTLTNKRINPRVSSVTSSATPGVDSDAYDCLTITALAAGAVFAAPTGTPVDFQPLVYRIKDDGTPRTLGYDGIFRDLKGLLPSTTVAGKTIVIGMLYNSAATKWDICGVIEEV